MKKVLILAMVLCFLIVSIISIVDWDRVVDSVADDMVERGRNRITNSFIEEIKVPVFFRQPNGYPYHMFDYVNDAHEKVHVELDLSTTSIRIEVTPKESREIIHGFIDHSNRSEYTKDKAFSRYDDATFDEYYKKTGYEKTIESFNYVKQEELLLKYFSYLLEATGFLLEAKGIK